MKEKFSDKYTVDELSDKVFPWACAVCIVLAIAYIVACIIDPWNIIMVPLILCGLGLVVVILGGAAAGLSIGIAKLIYFFEGAEE